MNTKPSILHRTHPAFLALLIGALAMITLPSTRETNIDGDLTVQRERALSNDEMWRETENDEHESGQEQYRGPILAPGQYMKALKETGQLQALQKVASPSDTDWQPIGPTGDFNSFDQPKPTNGRVRSIAVRSINGENYVYAGASSGGLWRSKVSTGPVWTSLGDRLPNPSVGAFAIHPNNPDDILVGTGDYGRYAGAGLFHTTDGGLSWTNVALPVSPGSFTRIQYLSSGAIVAASESGALRFANGNWSVTLTGFVSDLLVNPTNQNVQYCTKATESGNSGGVYKSTDAGSSWSLISAGTAPPNMFGIARLALCRDVPSTVAFMFEWNQNIQGIRKSTDGGSTWIDITGGLGGFGNGQAFHAQALAISPTNPDEIWVGANELWNTIFGGGPWTDVPKTVHTHQDYHQLFYSNLTGDALLWLCNDGGVYSDQTIAFFGNDAISWNGNNQSGLRISQVQAVDATRNFRVIGLQDDQAVASTNAGGSWSSYTCCDVYDVAITDDLNPTFWFDQYSGNRFVGGNVVKQLVGGATQNVSDPNVGLMGLFYDRFTDTVYSLANIGTSSTQLKSRPASATGKGTWTAELSGLGYMRNGYIRGSVLTGKTLFVWGDQTPTTLTVLQKNGTTWTSLRSPMIGQIGLNNYAIKAVFASTEQPGESWAALQNSAGDPKILHTTDYWQTNSDVTGSLPLVGQEIWAIAVTPFNSREIFIATDIGVFQTQNGGATWQPFQTGLPIVQCTSLRYVIDPSHNGNDKLVVGTYGRGVYERLLSRTPIVYVDSRNLGFKDGTFEHAYTTFDEGYAATPNNGILALHGNVYSPLSRVLNKNLLIHTYESLTVIH